MLSLSLFANFDLLATNFTNHSPFLALKSLMSADVFESHDDVASVLVPFASHPNLSHVFLIKRWIWTHQRVFRGCDACSALRTHGTP